MDATRRDFLIFGAAGGDFFTRSQPLTPIAITVSVMFDRGANHGRGLEEREIQKFRKFQEKARREFQTSGIRFDLHFVEGAFLRTQGYSVIPERFLVPRAINLFVTDTLAYDIDRDRTGGCSIGPRARRPGFSPDPFYKTFLGLKEARDTTLEHEYAHHFTLDTQRNPTVAGNSWADIRNDYWLWRQRHGAPVYQFRACVHQQWAAGPNA